MRALRAGVDNACLRVHLHRGEDAVRKCGGGAGRRIGCYCKLGAPPANTAQYVQDFNRQLASPDAARGQPPPACASSAADPNRREHRGVKARSP